MTLTDSPVICADFPAANIVVERVDGDSVFLRQDIRDSVQWWFWWAFEVRMAAPRTLRFRFTDGDCIGVRGPAVSRDGGGTWEWLGREAVVADGEHTCFDFAFSPGETQVRFAFSIPYTGSTLEHFLGQATFLTHGVLCRSGKDRDVPLLSYVPESPSLRLLLTARHHACECIANYVMEGILSQYGSDGPVGEWLRRAVEVWAVPFMDCDGVEEGDQGKSRHPRDHNRDYGADPIYPEVAAWQEHVNFLSVGFPGIALDLHCPHIRGIHNEDVYIVGSSDPVNAARQEQFNQVLGDVADGPWGFRPETLLRYGQGWNAVSNYSGGTSCARWLAGRPQVWMAGTIETPYAAVAGVPVTPESARALGADIAGALCRMASSGMLPPADSH